MSESTKHVTMQTITHEDRLVPGTKVTVDLSLIAEHFREALDGMVFEITQHTRRYLQEDGTEAKEFGVSVDHPTLSDGLFNGGRLIYGTADCFVIVSESSTESA